MKKAAFTLILFISSIPVFCQLKYTQNLKNVARINFPDTPKLKPLDKNILLYHYNGERELYFVQMAPLKKSLKDLLTDSINYKLYDGFIKGTLESVKSKLIYKKHALVDSLEGEEYFYTLKTADKKFYNYNRVVFFNDTLINFSMWSLDSLNRTDKSVDAYFKSFKITLPRAKIENGSARELGRKTGYFLGMLSVIAIPIVVISFIVLLVKKLGAKKKREWTEDDFK